jgi:hypothetical protein
LVKNNFFKRFILKTESLTYEQLFKRSKNRFFKPKEALYMSIENYGINMLIEYVFKFFFAHEKMRIYAEYLIDAVFQHNNELLDESIIIQENKSITLKSFGGKTMEFDFMATNNERKINIESENKYKSDYLPRIEAYASVIYLENFQRGMKYEQLLKTTTISLINYNLSDDNEFYTHHSIKLGSKTINNGKIEHYIIQIPKFRKYIKNLIKNNEMEKFINYLYIINYIKYYCT